MGAARDPEYAGHSRGIAFVGRDQAEQISLSVSSSS
jgi:hypothetical protein